MTDYVTGQGIQARLSVVPTHGLPFRVLTEPNGMFQFEGSAFGGSIYATAKDYRETHCGMRTEPMTIQISPGESPYLNEDGYLISGDSDQYFSWLPGRSLPSHRKDLARSYPEDFRRVEIVFSGAKIDPDDGPIVLRISPPALAPIVLDSREVAAAGSAHVELPTGSWTLHASTASLRSACNHISIRKDGMLISIDLAPLDVISGCVVDGWGRPVAYARIRARPDGAITANVPTTFSDRMGRFHLVACHHLFILIADHPSQGQGHVLARDLDGDHVHLVLRHR